VPFCFRNLLQAALVDARDVGEVIMDEINKQQMLDLIKDEWTALEEVLRPLDREKLELPGVESEWSVKDILAHITAWEKLMIQWLEESLRGETPQRPAPGESWDDLDEFNEQLYRDNKGKSLDEVLTEYTEIHARAVEIVTGMQEDDLIDPNRFAWRRGDPIWHLVAGNTWLHYVEHRETISQWIEASLA
jgi:hypothetical protein